MISNNYLFTNLKECSMKYRVYSLSSPLKKGTQTLLSEGAVPLLDIAPGETGKVHMKLPAVFFQGDVLELEAFMINRGILSAIGPGQSNMLMNILQRNIINILVLHLQVLKSKMERSLCLVMVSLPPLKMECLSK